MRNCGELGEADPDPGNFGNAREAHSVCEREVGLIEMIVEEVR